MNRAPRFNKMNAAPTWELDGVLVSDKDITPSQKLGAKRFHSWGEADRYLHLLAQQKAGKIFNLRCQVVFSCRINDAHICDYLADFTYTEDGKEVIEDVKGFKTDVYKLKKKLVESLHSVHIREVKPKRKPSKKSKA